jgi:hypothetical protein
MQITSLSGFFLFISPSSLIPQVPFIELYVVLFNHVEKFLLKSLPVMMLLLRIDVTDQVFQLAPTDGKASVAYLPGEITVLRRLRFNPGGGGLFDFLEEVGLGDSPRQSDREMDMVGNAADTVRFAMTVAASGSQVAVHSRPDGQVEPWTAIFSAEDDVDNDLAEGLRHMFVGLGELSWFYVTRREMYDAGRWPAMK